jgi:uracil phosphoribosyltransferase
VPLHLVEHPLVHDALMELRDARTEPPAFRRAANRISVLLAAEALRDVPTGPSTVITPLGPADGRIVRTDVVVVPVLRAGLGMAEAALGLLPEAQMGFVGLARDEETFEPRAYLESLPASLTGRPVLVLDPMLATGGSLRHCCLLLADRGADDITIVCAVAAPEGLTRLADSALPLRVVTAAVDERLNDRAYIVPGLGDAGDRQFGAV